MFKKLKNLIAPEAKAEAKKPSGHVYFGADKRKHVRIAYPKFGPIGRLPDLYLGSEKLSVLNLSTGGILLNAPKVIPNPGSIYDIKLTWKVGGDIMQKAKLLRVQGPHWHFQIMNAEPAFLVRFFDVTKAGDLGRLSVRITDTALPKKDGFSELWKSDNNHFVGFKKNEAHIGFGNDKYIFGFAYGLVTESGTPIQTDAPVLSELLLFLINIPRPSPNILELINGITTRYFKN